MVLKARLDQCYLEDLLDQQSPLLPVVQFAQLVQVVQLVHFHHAGHLVQ
jgi:hypothetical protein